MRLLRNLGRRRLRTGLTILGIAIGIWTLVVFGCMANRINAMVGNGSVYFRSGAIAVWTGGGSTPQMNPMDIALADRIKAVPGVQYVVPGVSTYVSDNNTTASMGLPPMITASVPGLMPDDRQTLVLRAAQGRLLNASDEGTNVVVLGCDLARQYDKNVGDTIVLRGESFRVVGVLAQTQTQPDNSAAVPFQAGQRLFLRTLPSLVRDSLKATDVVTSFQVYAVPGTDANEVAAAIRAVDPELGTMTGSDFDKMAGTYAQMLDDILVGIGLISLVVGGLSVVNTMAMAIAERTREIGIKRAIGATRLRIVREVVAESALIGSVGGLIGLVLGALVVALANEAGRTSGTVLFQMTAGTAVSAVLFATGLGAIAGFAPALHAARLDPVAALRYE
jgi:putative ABC transport system permease protein